MTIKVVILDHNAIFRLGLKKILTDEAIELVGEAADGITGMQVIRAQQPQVVLLANDLPKTNEISFCDWIDRYFPKMRTLFLLKNRDMALLNQLMKTSAKGFLIKDSGYLNPDVIQQIAEGKTYVQPDLALDIFQYSQPMNILSLREYQVLALISQGSTHEAISEKLNISIKTVFNTKYRGLKKLGAETIEKLRELLKSEL